MFSKSSTYCCCISYETNISEPKVRILPQNKERFLFAVCTKHRYFCNFQFINSHLCNIHYRDPVVGILECKMENKA